MAKERSKMQIIDEVIFAVQSVAQHYGPGFNTEGLVEIRKFLETMSWFCDSTWRCNVEDGPCIDFHHRLRFTDLNFKDVTAASDGLVEI